MFTIFSIYGRRRSFQGPSSTSSFGATSIADNASGNRCCSRSLDLITASAASTFQMTPITPLNFGRKVRSRADFRAAMMLVQTACSDIVEEDSYSSSAASGLQLKKLSPEDINQLAIDPEVSKVAFFRHKS